MRTQLNKYITEYGNTIKSETPSELINDVTEEILYYRKWTNSGSGPFLGHLDVRQIKHLTTNNLAKIVLMDSLSFKKIPFSKQEEVLTRVREFNPNFFTVETLPYFFEIMEGHVFNDFFGHIPLYRPLDENKRIFHNYGVSLRILSNEITIGGAYNQLHHPMIWDMNQFIKYTKLDVKYKQLVKMNDYGFVKMKSGYLEPTIRYYLEGNPVSITE